MKTAIAVKLNTGGLRARSSGAELVESLILNAQTALASSGNSKRDTTFTVHPLIQSLSSEKLAEMIKRAKEVTPDYEPADFGAWYQVHFDSEDQEKDDEIVQILTSLTESKEVASCQHLKASRAPAVQPSNDPYFPQQGYLSGSGVGINAQYAWGFPGGDGAGTNVIDVERGWQLEHEDLVAANITVLAGLNWRGRFDENYYHGTSVLGEMLMVDNAIGGVGIAPSANGDVVGIQRTYANIESPPEAILEAVSFLNFGDVLLLEMQAGDANGMLWPLEIMDAEYEAIKLATSMGITVIEPAGNGNAVDTGTNLDEPVIRPGETVPRGFLIAGSPDYRDSGAVMVGAGTSAFPRSRMPWSNYGSRVDVHAWGENILTSSVEVDVPGSGQYTDIYSSFSGTSGAAPIVAGAALSIQGMVNANRGSKLGPEALRSLIKTGGTPTTSSADRIGVQPDLRALIDGGYLN
ncbi:peptidase S8/S53 domain-containing protein [Stachybotrys elegans]|uniref:Peptidase S8/S53 domain-containing protein n=1 Tax=Stachybotrys elegans TaxID=80388 RepID=A0A8K0T1Q1_9HYPO|nr:peptidase S8/S53 domain-containing protein [Stachybotrys elegans]